jgi:hypothetical protein
MGRFHSLKNDCPSGEVVEKRAIIRKNITEKNEKKRQLEEESKRRSTRTMTATTHRKLQTLASIEFGFKLGFDTASKYFTNPEKLDELIYGKFIEWSLLWHDMQRCRRKNGASKSLPMKSVQPNLIMHVNKNFGHPSRKPYMVPWVSIRPSSLISSPGHAVGNGVFAERQFEKGHIVGVFVGKRVKISEDMTLETNEYCMYLHGEKYGVDAQGGVKSGYPLGMAMHIMNDPHFILLDPATNPNKARSANVVFLTQGFCVASKKIAKGQELLVHYSIGGVSQLVG